MGPTLGCGQPLSRAWWRAIRIGRRRRFPRRAITTSAGVVAFFAVCMNLVLILGVMAAMNATFTLPSIAGIVLTVGTAVDANVLIFERSAKSSIGACRCAWPCETATTRRCSAIIDSNMTTHHHFHLPDRFGSEEVKGFGITLIIGILASLFTALYVTQTIFGIMIDKFGVVTWAASR